MQIHSFDQGTDEWINIRLEKLTASDFHVLMGKSATRDKILYKKAAERLTGVPCDSDKFSSIHTNRGHELEGQARDAYELETGETITEVGFVQLEEFVGCSPDGLISELNDGKFNKGVEIKCMDNPGFLKAVSKSYISPEHKTQMQFCMYVCDLLECNYTLYNPNFQNPLHIINVARDDEYIEKIKENIIRCNEQIEEYINLYEDK